MLQPLANQWLAVRQKVQSLMMGGHWERLLSEPIGRRSEDTDRPPSGAVAGGAPEGEWHGCGATGERSHSLRGPADRRLRSPRTAVQNVCAVGPSWSKAHDGRRVSNQAPVRYRNHERPMSISYAHREGHGAAGMSAFGTSARRLSFAVAKAMRATDPSTAPNGLLPLWKSGTQRLSNPTSLR